MHVSNILELLIANDFYDISVHAAANKKSMLFRNDSAKYDQPQKSMDLSAWQSHPTFHQSIQASLVVWYFQGVWSVWSLSFKNPKPLQGKILSVRLACLATLSASRAARGRWGQNFGINLYRNRDTTQADPRDYTIIYQILDVITYIINIEKTKITHWHTLTNALGPGLKACFLWRFWFHYRPCRGGLSHVGHPSRGHCSSPPPCASVGTKGRMMMWLAMGMNMDETKHYARILEMNRLGISASCLQWLTFTNDKCTLSSPTAEACPNLDPYFPHLSTFLCGSEKNGLDQNYCDPSPSNCGNLP